MTSTSWAHRAAKIAKAMRGRYPRAVLVSDLGAFIPAFVAAGFARNEIESIALNWIDIAILASICAATFVAAAWLLKLYTGRYRVARFPEVLRVGGAWTAAGIVSWIVDLVFFDSRIPTSVVAVGLMFVGVWFLASRSAWRMIEQTERRPDPMGRTRVLVFGAGEGGESVVRSMLNDPGSQYYPIAILDDDPGRQNRVIQGIPVSGTREDIGTIAAQADTLLIAIPSAEGNLIDEVSSRAQSHGLDVMVLPSTTELFGLMATMESARPLEITDLLGRREVEIDNASVSSYLTGKTVLVTGAGGSIGSEICRQILNFHPAKLLMVDRDETALQDLDLSIDGDGLLRNDSLILADIRNPERVRAIFETHRPSIVFHAAALKHLPMLEAHPHEAVLTNVIGTRNVLQAAAATGVDRFVNVSTDKAANPTSILGVSKRMAEALTAQVGSAASGRYMSVRFGNVLGSRGSVVPVFESRIAADKPLQITHPDVTRYFMSITEASRLVLQAGAIGETGETLVLDMGEPVQIVDLARKLLRHHGSSVGIEFTELRPGEKLHETLGHEGEVMATRDHQRVWHTTPQIEPVAHIESLLDLDADGLHRVLMASATENHAS